MHALKLHGDGLSLVYHEARHARFLIQAGHVSAVGWEQLVSLPRNGVEAWRQLQPLRRTASGEETASRAARIFHVRFRRNLEELLELYANSNWKHSACGGNSWRQVTQLVVDLEEALERGKPQEIQRACGHLIAAHHNNGSLREKIVGLDLAVGPQQVTGGMKMI